MASLCLLHKWLLVTCRFYAYPYWPTLLTQKIYITMATTYHNNLGDMYVINHMYVLRIEWKWSIKSSWSLRVFSVLSLQCEDHVHLYFCKKHSRYYLFSTICRAQDEVTSIYSYGWLLTCVTVSNQIHLLCWFVLQFCCCWLQSACMLPCLISS